MIINLTIGVVVHLLSAIPFGIASAISFYDFVRTKYRHILCFALAWIGGMIWTTLQGLSFLWMSKIIHIIGLMSLIPVTFFIILVLEYLSRETVNPAMIGIITGLSTGIIIFSFTPDAVTEITYPNGELSLTTSAVLYWNRSIDSLSLCDSFILGRENLSWFSPKSKETFVYLLGSMFDNWIRNSRY